MKKKETEVVEKGSSDGGQLRPTILERVGSFAQRKSGLVIWGTVVLTLLLLFPLLFMAPTETAKDNPGGEVFDIREEIETIMPPSIHEIWFVVEAKDGDMLTQEELWELYQNEEELRRSGTGRDFLYTRYDAVSGTITFGVYTIADAVQALLLTHPEFGVTLENASDEMVKLAVHHVLTNPASAAIAESFSKKATNETRTIMGQPVDYWQSPAILFVVNVNNSRLPQEATPGLSAGTGGGLEHQKYNREVQQLLRGDQENYRLWGIAIDLSLEANEEGALSFPLVMLAVIVILVIVSIHFRSLQVTVLTLLGLGMLIVWLKGFSNLAGLRSSLVLDIIVPIAILVLGVDYAIHSVHRYLEERGKGAEPGRAFREGIVGVGGALILAMLTTVVAFLSNVSSGVEEIIGFGVAAAIAIVSALIIMGLFVPAVKMRWDTRRLRRQSNGDQPEGNGGPAAGTESGGRSGNRSLSGVVCSVADRRVVVLPTVLIISLVAVYYATNLESKLDAKEYFDSGSDFVISLDKMDEHSGESGGEGAIIYIKGDLSEPESLMAIRKLIDNMEDDETVARRPSDGKPNVIADIFVFLEAVLESNVSTARIEASNPGISITDNDGDGIPDNQAQLRAVYGEIAVHGIALNETLLHYEPSQIGASLFHDPMGVEEDATVVWTRIPGTREQTVVKESRVELTEDMEALEADSISYFGLAGPGYERDVTLDATTNSLTTSIGIATVLCFIILLIAFRSLKYAIVTIIPVVLVAAWLYAFMYLAGFHLNAVTATIAAISIGVGVDYSVHITARFRQELERSTDRRTALDHATSQSGSALFGSAASTTLGFAIITFAPMPLFSSFGLLTALMILMAFVAALFVLPSLLILIARDS
jgi:predicted RND superfamily exporter protein